MPAVQFHFQEKKVSDFYKMGLASRCKFDKSVNFYHMNAIDCGTLSLVKELLVQVHYYMHLVNNCQCYKINA